MIDLSGRVALVTGGSRGIGWACAEALAAAGADVAITYRETEDAAREAVAELKDGGSSAEAFRLDLEDEASIAGAVERVIERFGRVDILVNNAGTWNTAGRPIESMPTADLDRMLATNLRGTIL